MDRNHLIEKVLTGKANSIEIKELNDWLEMDPSHRWEWQAAQFLYASAGADMTPNEIQIASWAAVKSKIKTNQIVRTWRTIATAVGGTLASVFLVFLLLSQQTEMTIQFANSTLNEVIACVENKFDIDIELESSNLGQCSVSGIFHHVRSPEEVILAVAKSMDLKYIRKDSETIQLLGVSCGKRQ